jgi:hypothetical protein
MCTMNSDIEEENKILTPITRQQEEQTKQIPFHRKINQMIFQCNILIQNYVVLMEKERVRKKTLTFSARE